MKLKVTETNFGYFYKAELDGFKLDFFEFEQVTGLSTKRRKGFRFSEQLREWHKDHPEYELEINEIDVT